MHTPWIQLPVRASTSGTLPGEMPMTPVPYFGNHGNDTGLHRLVSIDVQVEFVNCRCNEGCLGEWGTSRKNALMCIGRSTVMP